MNTKMTHRPERLMMYFIGLLIIVVGLGLATGRNPQSDVPDSYPSPVSGQAPASAMPMPAATPTPLVPVGQVVAPRTTAPVRMATEGEWLGLEVAPITQLTAGQYGIPYGTRGLVVAEAEAQAAIAGLRAGDVVLSVNGAPISNMTDFFQATWNGTLTKGVVEVLRQGRKLALNIAQTTPPALTATPNRPVNVPSGSMPAPLSTASAPPQQKIPSVAVNQAFPQTAGSSQIKMLPFQEAHWQGLEVIPLTRGLRQVLKILPDAKGVIVDDVTGPADMEGFQAGDLIVSVGQVSTPTLESFIKAADRVRHRRQTKVQLLRKGQPHSLILTAFGDRLGTANGEAAPMIKPGNRPPHGYQGPCTQCHRIGTKGQLAMDQGDLLSREAPQIFANQAPPHRDRGECTACHKIIR